MACGRCADQARLKMPQDSHSRLVRAVLFGLVGFAIGLTLYAAFVIITGISIGYAALAVGWIVGKAVLLGSGGVGGRKYQIAAVLLTYAAVSMAVIPIAVSMIIKKQSASHTETVARQAPSTPGQADASPLSSPQTNPEAVAADKKPPKGAAAALGYLMLLGLVSPFLELSEGFSGFIGLIILLVGMQFAWKMTAGPPAIGIEGPYELTAS